MKLSKAQREHIRLMFDGKCAYCGQALGKTWHADHIKPVERELSYTTTQADNGTYQLRIEQTGKLRQAQNDCLNNYFPACVPCNLHKSNMSLAQWRSSLEKKTEELRRDSSAYRHALRFGLITENHIQVQFYFETQV